MATVNLKTLARYSDSLSFIYLDHAVIEKDEQSVAAFTKEGRIGLPAANLATLLLGPGTRITHAAINVLAGAGCVVAWVGEDGLRHYAAGQNRTRSSALLEAQCRAWAQPESKLAVVYRLYELRFAEPLDRRLSLNQVRGREGARVRDAYRALADRFGIAWQGRQYERDDWAAADPVNRALSAANAALYAVVLAGLHSLGYSPALGFIHVGKQLSFVYDLADVYKLVTSVPAAFEAASSAEPGVEKRARTAFRRLAGEQRLLDRITGDLGRIFGECEPEATERFDDSPASPGELWDPAGNVAGGVAHDRPGD